MSSYFQVDATSIVILVLLVIALAAHVYLRPSPPHLHPFLLGRQSTAAPTRFPGESPAYRGTGGAGFGSSYRPATTVRTLADVLGKGNTCLEGGERGTWVKGGEKLVGLVDALRAGLLSKFAGLEGKVLVAVSDPTDALLVTLALATSPLKPVVLAPGGILPASLDVVAAVQTADASLTISENTLPSGAPVVLLGEEHKAAAYEILATGRSQAVEASAAEAKDVAITIVSDGVALELTHQNLTSSLVTWLALFPASPTATKPTLKDFLVSFHHPSTPYGLGLALLAIYQHSSLSLLSLPAQATTEQVGELFANKSAPPASLVFGPEKELAQPLYTLILQQMLGDSALIINQSRNGKLRLLRSGTISKQTIWDSFLFKGLRKDLHLTHLRSVVFSGPVEQSRLETFRVALGCPTFSTLEHPLLLAPLSTANMWDVQRLPPPSAQEVVGREKGHVGAPAVGMEIKFKGEESEFEAGRVRGEILLRTPILPHAASLPSTLLTTDETLPPLPAYPNKPSATVEGSKWLKTGVRAELGPEGTIWVEEK